MPSDGPPPFRLGGGGLTWRRSCYAQRLSLRGRSPRRCGWGLSRNAASDAGQHGFPASAATMRSEAAPRVSPLAWRNGAPHERGAGGESDPPLFRHWCATGEGKGGGPLPPVRGGRSHHSDPCGKAELLKTCTRGCTAHPGFDCRRTSSLALTLACPRRGRLGRPGAGNRSLGPLYSQGSASFPAPWAK